MNNLKLCLFCFFCLAGLAGFSQQITETKRIEKLISNCIDSAFRSSVYIIEYDTLTKQVQEGAGFSGVVVSAEGHILTVSHAARPDQVYLIRFPDGAEHIAIGLGRIGIQNEKNDLDLAMLRILRPGKWPFAKMGWSRQMKLHQPVISISYPSSFDKQLPNVRFGRLTKADFTDGYIESTCKMEPGDSGGPLFDADGRVIGLHSWIKADEDQNFDVPVDLYRKYWSALNVAKDYTELPEADKLPFVDAVTTGFTIPSIQQLANTSAALNERVVQLTSKFGNGHITISGTKIDFISASGTAGYILSKSSMVADRPTVIIGGKAVPAVVLSRDKKNDLVLLGVSVKLLNGIKLKYNQNDLDVGKKMLGILLISAVGGGAKKVGVLSSEAIDMPMNFSAGYFGANATYINQKVTITEISKGSAAEMHLRLKDQIVAVNGTVLLTPADYGKELSKYLAGDSLSIDAVREGKSLHLKMRLPAYPAVKHVSYEFSGGRSTRSDGFNKVFVHDAAIRADECGSPVFNTAGEFYGINIARHSRSSTIVMPVGVLAKFINKASVKQAKLRQE